MPTESTEPNMTVHRIRVREGEPFHLPANATIINIEMLNNWLNVYYQKIYFASDDAEIQA